MNTISYLKEIYGYSTPIFLKDIRIGRKSKTAIRKELSRAVVKGEIIRDSQGVYYFDPKDGIPGAVSFEDVLEYRFIKDDCGIKGLDLNVYGYYTGYNFLNYLGISQQVPAVLEIVTNNTSCKRIFKYNGYTAILRKGKIIINRYNHKVLQFFDAFYLLSMEDIKQNKKLLENYIANNFSKKDFELYIDLYPSKVIKAIVEGGLIHAFR